MKNFVEKQLDLTIRPFEFNQQNTIDSEEEKLKIEVESDTKATK